jgi:AcrR family transcriptional regulator
MRGTPVPHPAVDTTDIRIIETATRVLAEDSGASMQEVARRTGVGRATLYRYYGCREDLLRAIRVQALRECREALGGVPVDEGSAIDALEQVVAALVPVLDRYRVLADAGPPDRSDPEQAALAEEVEGPLIRIIRRGQERGELTPELTPSLALEVIVGVLRAARRGIVSGEVTADAAPPLAFRLLIDGLRSRPG